MKIRHFIITITIGVMGLVGTAQAGHLFTQGGNPSVPITAGNGLDMNQTSVLAFQSGPSFFNLSGWGSGDVMRMILGTFTQTFAFDALPAGWMNGGGSGSLETIGTTAVSDPGLFGAALPGTPFSWRIEALAGAFTIDGFGLRMAGGLPNGAAVQGFSVNPNRVPEPGILVLMGLGLAGIGLARRRRENI